MSVGHESSDDEKGHPLGHHAEERLVDVAAQLVAGKEGPIDPVAAQKLKRKLDWHLMPLMCIMYLMTFADKTTLGQSAVLGILPGAHLTQDEFNWLSTAFYISYLAFQYPQNLALQKFPVGKWMSINIFVWAVALLAHAACSSFGGLMACRLILGACEGSITPGFMIVTCQFYTRTEQTRRVGNWCLMNGIAIVFLGIVSFGLLHTHTKNFAPWKWLMIITGIITLIVSVTFWFFFPDSPTTAAFLTPEERVLAVQRIKVNQAGVENKVWKREQFVETFKDKKVWLCFLFAALSNVMNSLSVQRQLLVNQLGFTVNETTLFGMVDGVISALFIAMSVTIAGYTGRGYGGIIMYGIAILGELLINLLPSSNKYGLLCSYWISTSYVSPYVIFLGWVGSMTSGHTKKTTTNAVVLIGYAVGNIAGPFIWKKQYQPRNHVPWTIMTVCSFVSALLFLSIRFMLARENKIRDAVGHDNTYDDVYISQTQKDGTLEEKKVDRAFLDLTDLQNKEFRYPL